MIVCVNFINCYRGVDNKLSRLYVSKLYPIGSTNVI